MYPCYRTAPTGSRRRSLICRWARAVQLATVCALASAALADADASDTRGPLGRLVSVGSHSLHLYCTGEGVPTVVLESGIGGNHLDWIRAQPEISRATRVCSYDRAGYGWSEPGPKPRTADRITAELSVLLRNAGIDGPIVLVGHSFGGVLSLYYANRFSGQVGALVLVDSMHPDQYERFAAENIDVPVEPTRAVIHTSPEMLTFGMPDEFEELAYELARRSSARAFMFNELRNIRETMEQVNGLVGVKPQRAEVIVHGRREWDRIYRDGRMENLWIRLQSDLARRIGANRLIVSPRSGHLVPLEDPELVGRVVRSLIRDLRAQPGADGHAGSD